MEKKTGTLWVVATPIGNLEDFSQRAVSVLKSVDKILAEDTRHSRHLLAHYGITTSMSALSSQHEAKHYAYWIEQLQAGKTLALISDAGTPLISDPGVRLVHAAHVAGAAVLTVPGPCAAIAALSVSGLPTDRFVFEGFLSSKTGARQKRLAELVADTRTMIFYEAPHRVLDSLSDLISVFGGEREAVLVKELTKIFETVYRATLQGLLNWLQEDSLRQKGEFVILVHGASHQQKSGAAGDLDASSLRILTILRKELSAKQAASLTASITGASKNSLYRVAYQEECGQPERVE